MFDGPTLVLLLLSVLAGYQWCWYCAVPGALLFLVYGVQWPFSQFQYSYEHEPATENCSAVYRHPGTRGKGLTTSIAGNIETLQDVVFHAEANNADLPCLGTRPLVNGKLGDFEYVNYGEVIQDCRDFGSGLLHLNLVPVLKEQGQSLRFLSIFAPNHRYWYTTDIACMMYGFTLAPLEAGLHKKPDFVVALLNQSETQTLVLTTDKAECVLKLVKDGKLHFLKTLVFMDQVEETNGVRDTAENLGLKTLRYGEVMQAGRKNEAKTVKYSKDHPFTLCYTSGTTGSPKGAIYTHANVIGLLAAIDNSSAKITGQDTHFSYLPLHHVAERASYINIFYNGGKIGIFNGNLKLFLDDIAVLKPTVFISVPRIYNKTMTSVQMKIKKAGSVVESLFKVAFNNKVSALQRCNTFTHKLWDRLVFKKTKLALGGRLKYMITAAAPIQDSVKDFMRVIMSCPMFEAYGQTECAGVCTVTDVNDPTNGHVGGPVYTTEIKLEDIPAMNYLHTDSVGPRGEICLRGCQIIPGYFRMPKKTAETIDQDGWLHTGDVGQILPNGALKIIDRKKNLFKLSQGEYVSPEKSENVYSTLHWVEECFIYGNSLQDYVVGIFVISESFPMFVKDSGFEYTTPEELFANEDFLKVCHAEMRKNALEKKLHSYEMTKQFCFLKTSLGEDENGNLLTSTKKLKRKNAEKFFKQKLAELYKLPRRR